MIKAFSGAGHTSAQFPHPVQSSGDITIEYCNPSNVFPPLAATMFMPSGAFLASSAVNKAGLITACGQTNEHWLHWIHLSACQDRKSTRLNSSHANISYAVFCLK